ncbi:MAG: molybdate ABC transporter substrate-binding protein [Gammaproteobacteria bacterium]|nr:molybdate ABC transporter substrate-binding protein [Gammaproteobacteria bacterium]
MKINLLFIVLWLLTATLLPAPLAAAEIRVAVASNFADTMQSIATRFEARTDHKVTLISGSTGKHYAQIVNGAPFDAFFAADSRRPETLEKQGVILPGNRFTYAIGKLVLWSPEAAYVDTEGNILQGREFRFLAIANPKLAPYGKAAQEVLQARGLWKALQERLVRGENINQAFQFVSSGNAELGFVAYSQVRRPGESIKGSYWVVPQALYIRIQQQAVFLTDNEATRALRLFVQSDEVLELIQNNGYDAP